MRVILFSVFLLCVFSCKKEGNLPKPNKNYVFKGYYFINPKNKIAVANQKVSLIQTFNTPTKPDQVLATTTTDKNGYFEFDFSPKLNLRTYYFTFRREATENLSAKDVLVRIPRKEEYNMNIYDVRMAKYAVGIDKNISLNDEDTLWLAGYQIASVYNPLKIKVKEFRGKVFAEKIMILGNDFYPAGRPTFHVSADSALLWKGDHRNTVSPDAWPLDSALVITWIKDSDLLK